MKRNNIKAATTNNKSQKHCPVRKRTRGPGAHDGSRGSAEVVCMVIAAAKAGRFGFVSHGCCVKQLG